MLSQLSLCAALALLPPLSGAIVFRELSDSTEVHQSEGIQPFDPTLDGVLVYSEPKTGTSTLEWGAGGMFKPPCRVHDCTVSEDVRLAMKCHNPGCARDFLMRRREGSRVWVISSNRNPFTQRPSEFFQGMGGAHSPESWSEVSVDELLTKFHEKAVWNLETPMQWWKAHYLEPFGLNVTAYPFDFKKKLLHISYTWSNRHLEVLILRVEDSSEWGVLLRPFFPTLSLRKANEGDQKGYAEVYAEFLRRLEWTDLEMDIGMQSEALKHFYTPHEVQEFLKQARDSSKRQAVSELDPLVEREDARQLPYC